MSQLEMIKYECFDYVALTSVLASLHFPRNAISRLMNSGKITRVKKGIYVKGDGRGASRCVLANMIYGPSYVSLDYVLANGGLIPERVYTITSMATKRRRAFDTPLGRFEYEPIAERSFAIGVVHQAVDDGAGYLTATPEKALADRLARVPGLMTLQQLDEYLFGDMRVDRGRFRALSRTRMSAIARAYRNRNVSLLNDLLIKDTSNE